MADRIIYVNTDVDTGTYGNPDGTRGAGVRDGTSRTKGYRTLKEAFAQTANFLTQEFSQTNLTAGNNLIYRLSGTTADTAGAADMNLSSWNVLGDPADETRVIIEGDPGVSSGAIDSLTWNTNKYRFHADLYADSYWLTTRKNCTIRRLQGGTTYIASAIVRLLSQRTLVDGVVLTCTHSSTRAAAGVQTSYANDVAMMRIVSSAFYGLENACLLRDFSTWVSGAELTFANNVISRCGASGSYALRFGSDGTPRANLRVMNNCIVACNGPSGYVDVTGMSSSYIGYNATDGTISGQSNGIDNITPTAALMAPTPGTITAFDLAIKDANSALVNAGLAYSGSGNAQYVPQTDYLGRTRGSGGRGWDVGADSWLSGGGGGGVRRAAWIC